MVMQASELEKTGPGKNGLRNVIDDHLLTLPQLLHRLCFASCPLAPLGHLFCFTFMLSINHILGRFSGSNLHIRNHIYSHSIRWHPFCKDYF